MDPMPAIKQLAKIRIATEIADANLALERYLKTQDRGDKMDFFRHLVAARAYAKTLEGERP